MARPLLTYGQLLPAITPIVDHCSGCGQYAEIHGRVIRSDAPPFWFFFCERCAPAISVVLPALLNQGHTR
jgi:hypothetical protein